MKCENCGKNDVSFVYQSNINGRVEEKHLCADCAAKLGYSQKLAAHSQRMMQDFMGGFGSFFDDFFAPMPRLLGRMAPLLEDPFDDFFAEMPALGAPAAQQEQEPEQRQQKDGLVDQESQSRFSRMRELNALRSEMKKAVHREDFERAAQLRDQIHQLEQKS